MSRKAIQTNQTLANTFSDQFEFREFLQKSSDDFKYPEKVVAQILALPRQELSKVIADAQIKIDEMGKSETHFWLKFAADWATQFFSDHLDKSGSTFKRYRFPLWHCYVPHYGAELRWRELNAVGAILCLWVLTDVADGTVKI